MNLNNLIAFFKPTPHIETLIDSKIHESFDWKSGSLDENIEWFPDLYRKLQESFFEFRHFDRAPDQNIQYFYDEKSSGYAISDLNSVSTQKWPKAWLRFTTTFLLEQGYVVHLSETKSQRIKEIHDITYHIYLKPSRKLPLIDKQAQQKYGNVELTFIERNQRPHLIKCMAHTYADQHFYPAEEFTEFLKQISKFNNI